MKYFIFTIFLVLSTGLLSIETGPAKAAGALAQSDLEELGAQWLAFEQSWNNRADDCYLLFNEFRQTYRSVEFLLPMISSEQEIQSINNSKFWVWQDTIFQRQYPGTGSLQFLEKKLSDGPDIKAGDKVHLERVRRFIEKTRRRFEKMEIPDRDFLFALVMDQYRQYFLTLSAYDRLDSEVILTEYRGALAKHARYLQAIDRNQATIKLAGEYTELERIGRVLADVKFVELERIPLLKEDLQPLLASLSEKARMLAQGQIPGWAEVLQWNGATPFSAQWLNPFFFTDIENTAEYPGKVAVGKLLFFDPILSSNGKRTCASCHKPQKAFTDGRITSQGFDFSAKLLRNSPSLVNTVFNREFGHDGRFGDLQAQIRSVIYDHQEFRSTLPEITAKLATSDEYMQWFVRCFPGQSVIDSNQVLEVLAAYSASLVSFSSPLDQYMQGKLPEIEESVSKGYDLFMGKAMCGGCHFAPLFSGLKPPTYVQQEYHSHGVDRNFESTSGQPTDPGRAGIELSVQSVGSLTHYFKTPTLRNLPQSAPYMHQGSFNALEDFFDFLRYGQTAPGHQGSFPPGAVRLTGDEYQSLLDFLDALNDQTVARKHHEQLRLPLTDGSLVPARRRAAGVY